VTGDQIGLVLCLIVVLIGLVWTFGDAIPIPRRIRASETHLTIEFRRLRPKVPGTPRAVPPDRRQELAAGFESIYEQMMVIDTPAAHGVALDMVGWIVGTGGTIPALEWLKSTTTEERLELGALCTGLAGNPEYLARSVTIKGQILRRLEQERTADYECWPEYQTDGKGFPKHSFRNGACRRCDVLWGDWNQHGASATPEPYRASLRASLSQIRAAGVVPPAVMATGGSHPADVASPWGAMRPRKRRPDHALHEWHECAECDEYRQARGDQDEPWNTGWI
jgi:hypothetical protein